MTHFLIMINPVHHNHTANVNLFLFALIGGFVDMLSRANGIALVFAKGAPAKKAKVYVRR